MNVNLNPLRERQTQRTRNARIKAAIRIAVVLAVFVGLSVLIWMVRP